MQLDLAVARQNRLAGLADRAGARAVQLWRAGMTAEFDASWAGIAGRVATVASVAQIAAAVGASPYLARTASADRWPVAAGGDVAADAFAGVDASGRTIDGLLYGAVTAAKTSIGRGGGVSLALNVGATYLNTMVHTAVLDTGRSADLTASTSRLYTHYIRVVSAGACSRCAILAGIASGKEAFKRHPRCRCTAAPESRPENPAHVGKFASPTDYFDSLSKAEQDRVFTSAGAEAIRAGADPIAIVTARRGAPGIDYSRSIGLETSDGRRSMVRTVIGHHPDGSPILGYTTGESTTRRGTFGRQQQLFGTTKRIRVMPETIIGLTEDPELRRVLLRDAGYLTVPMTQAEMSAPLTGGYLARRAAVIREDRAVAEAFYRTHHITLG